MRLVRITTEEHRVVMELEPMLQAPGKNEITVVEVRFGNDVGPTIMIRRPGESERFLVMRGEIDNRPVDRNKLNAVTSELQSALSLLAKLDVSDE